MPHLLELFCGTKSIGKVFEQNGWTVTSVDIKKEFEPDICCNVLDLTPEMIGTVPDLLWASPPCTLYSRARTTAKTPRDLVGSDKMVQKVLDLAAHYGCSYFFENPWGLLKTREVLQGIPMRVIDYCKYNDGDHPHKARKRTCIWTNTDWIPRRSLCKKDCGYCDEQRKKHLDNAEMVAKEGRPRHTLIELYTIPKALPQELCAYISDGGS